MSLSIIQRECHNVSIEKSPRALAPDLYLSGLRIRLAGIVDLSHDLEAVELVQVLPVSYMGPISELGGRPKGRKKGEYWSIFQEIFNASSTAL